MRNSWLNEACDLEAAGCLEEAQALIDAHTTPEERQAMADGLSAIAHTLSRLGEDEGFAKYRMAFRDPDHPNSEVLLLLNDIEPEKALRIARALPAPLRPGRPGGTGEDDQCRVEALRARLAVAGGKPTTVAKEILREERYPDAQLKSKADYIVRLFNKQNKSAP